MNIFSILEDIRVTGFNVLLEPLFQESKTLLRNFNERRWASCSDLMDEIITCMDARVRVFKMLKNPHRQGLVLLSERASIARRCFHGHVAGMTICRGAYPVTWCWGFKLRTIWSTSLAS
ncbi:Tumor necrosis factor alpha-induced protein 2 [Ophiophagus hannah]|uniref:Tumor necrosis factor alpha-induced protein 2 n=1 Tax=Ophiophagus hannah TaxID=8665 RepID=V8NR13_OPHHA|nr:Tumor necrosis factor alpha-induced protein 2 [Ophiophagus hannah]